MEGTINRLFEAGLSNAAILVIMDVIAHAVPDDAITIQSLSDRRKISTGIPIHGSMNKVRRSVRELCRAGYMFADSSRPGCYLAAGYPKWANGGAHV